MAHHQQHHPHASTSPSARFADDGKTNEEKSETLYREASGVAVTDEASSKYATSSAGLDHKHGTMVAERKLVFKLDRLILPLCMMLYLSAYLDRGNMGNARLQGLEREVLGNDDTKYSVSLALFFVTYIVFNIPGTLLAKAISPSQSIAGAALLWSIAATCQAVTTNPAGLYVCRLFIGIGEAGFGQAVPFYFSMWYKKSEMAKRVGLYITCGALAGAFGGLIAFGVAHINSSIAQWRVLFLIEGLPGVVLAIIVWICLPSRPDKSRYLKNDERTLACTRLNSDSLGGEQNGIVWSEVRYAFCDWRIYAASVLYSCMNLGLGSVGGFLPTIIKNLGYSNAQAQLFTVPPYAVTMVFMLIMTSLSDRFRIRGPFVASVFLIGIAGWSILLTVDAKTGNQSVRYLGCFLVVMAGYTDIPLIISWMANNTARESQRAVTLGMLNTVGQCLSVAAAFIFPSSQGPQYLPGCTVNIAFQTFGFCIAIFLHTYFKRENRRRNAVEGKPIAGERLVITERLDRSPGFRYVE